MVSVYQSTSQPSPMVIRQEDKTMNTGNQIDRVSFRDRAQAERLLLHVRGSLSRWSQTPHWGGVLSHWEETPWQTQDTLERLNLLACLGTPWDSPRGAGASGWGEESLSLNQSEMIHHAKAAALRSPNRRSS